MAHTLYFIYTEYKESKGLLNALEQIAEKLKLRNRVEAYNGSLSIWLPDAETLEFYFLDKKKFTRTLGDFLESYGTVFYMNIYPHNDEDDKLVIPVVKEFLAEYPYFLFASPDTVPDGVSWYIYTKEDFDSFDTGNSFAWPSPPPLNPEHIIKD